MTEEEWITEKRVDAIIFLFLILIFIIYPYSIGLTLEQIIRLELIMTLTYIVIYVSNIVRKTHESRTLKQVS